MLLLAACAPDIDPPWLISAPRELIMEVEVTEQGPYGERITDRERSSRDALPRDTLSLRPVVIDRNGPLDPDALEGRWLMCAGLGGCALQAPVASVSRCANEQLRPAEPCRFGEGGRATLTLGDVSPDQLDGGSVTLFSLVSGPTVVWIGSAPQGPGVEECIARLDAREHLEGCLLMERLLRLGPLAELAALLEEAGLDPGLTEGAQTLLARPRNRNPAVTSFALSYGGQTRTLPAGARASVPRRQELQLTVITTEADRDPYEVEVEPDGLLVEFSDNLDAQWLFDREIERLDQPADGTGVSVRWRTGDQVGTVRVFVALRDDHGGEGWGSLQLEIGG